MDPIFVLMLLSGVSVLFTVYRGWWDKLPSAIVSSKSPPPKVKNRPHGEQPIFRTSSKYHMTMGLRKSDTQTWLNVDNNYLEEHKVRVELINSLKGAVVRCLPGSEEACEEALNLIAGYLTLHYPDSFERVRSQSSGESVRMVSTGETYKIDPPYKEIMPLEIAAALAMEDFNILMKNAEGQHVLLASATCFPAGWSLEERIGWPIYKLHNPVPLWQGKLGHPVERFLSNIAPDTSKDRSAYFVQVVDPGADMAKTLYQPNPLKYDTKPSGPESILIRSERQTFRRLPLSDAVLHTVKTSLTYLTDLSTTDLRAFSIDARSWPDEVAEYKGRPCWGECALTYCDRLANTEP